MTWRTRAAGGRDADVALLANVLSRGELEMCSGRLDLDDMGAELGGDPLRIGANVVDRPLSLLCDILSPRNYKGLYNNISL
jgi:hypothetical protein